MTITATEVPVGPFRVADLDRTALVRLVVDRAAENLGRRPTTAYALHVGGLNARTDERFVAAMQRADVVYADGGSVVLVARMGGAQALERAATTDVGEEILHGLAEHLGDPPRVAFIGGPPGLARRAGDVLARQGAAEVVLTEHGYHQDWAPVLERLRAARPDVVVVGLGAPREMIWVDQHLEDLPPALVLTCGGWFGHLTGEESRAPGPLRRAGLEWIARFAQAPGRLGPRYLRGMWSTAALCAQARRGTSGSGAGRQV